MDINGKQEKICVPFVMLTGVLLDNDVFSNVSVSNGKIVNDGGLAGRMDRIHGVSPCRSGSDDTIVSLAKSYMADVR